MLKQNIIFHKPRKFPILSFNNYEIERSSSIKCLGVMVDEHLNWNDHINILENKLSRSSRPEVFYRKGPTLLKKRLWRWCFLVNFVKFLGTLFYREHLLWLLLTSASGGYYSFFHGYLTYGSNYLM